MTRGGVAVAAIALLAGGAYVGSPYWTAHGLEVAAHSDTPGDVVRYFDLPAVREAMRTELKHRLEHEGEQLAKNPFGGELGDVLNASIVDKIVGEILEPDRLRDMIAFGLTVVPKDGEKPAFAAINGEYVGLDEYELTVPRPEGNGKVRLKLERRGLLTWKVVDIEFVPEAAHAVKTSEMSAPGELAAPSPPAVRSARAPTLTPVTVETAATRTDDYDCANQPPRKSTDSLDGGFTYVQVCRATTSDVIIQIRKSDGQRRDVTSGNSLAVLRSGPWRGMLLVAKHKYKAGGGSFDATWVVRPDGKEMFQIPGTEDGDEGQVQAWLRGNGWTAD